MLTLVLGGLGAACSDGTVHGFVDAYTLTDDSALLVTYVTTGKCDKIARVEVDENRDHVRIRPSIRVSPTCDTIRPAEKRFEVRLSEALGERTVLNWEDNVVPQRPRRQ